MHTHTRVKDGKFDGWSQVTPLSALGGLQLRLRKPKRQHRKFISCIIRLLVFSLDVPHPWTTLRFGLRDVAENEQWEDCGEMLGAFCFG
ncbi:hypothetical protein TNIN_94791 [Trichonephila inaurata madagascariensis]|uniref:Uncharacterized protein n=1 Tax=Trichonephila inaurata madagascariensis TaxID=2747483 RepID=A0A8X7CSB2_9ARAC|nr:hypothetical protein TNIN_94791 [Trichonephila inaurata madagascariensis]